MISDKEIQWIPIGTFIEQCFDRNSDGLYGDDDAIGVNIDKEIRRMKGNNENKNLKTFFLVKPGYFVFNPRGSRKLGLGYNDSDKTFITTFNNIIFKVKEDSRNLLNPQYLFLYLSRKEWDRRAEYLSWGSSTEVFSLETLKKTVLPVPTIEKQNELVDVWSGICKLKTDNLSLSIPLYQLCEAKIDNLKKEYPLQPIADLIREVNERNTAAHLGIDAVRGVSIQKVFIPTKANMDNVPLTSYKIVQRGQFASNPNTARMGDKICVALNDSDEVYLVSAIYPVFECVNKNVLLPQYLYMWFKRDEFNRYARFHSWGSAREMFDYSDFEKVQIPLPPIEIQKAVVDLFSCAQEAETIAKDAEALSKQICPALFQKIINS